MAGSQNDGVDKLKSSIKSIFKRKNKRSVSQSKTDTSASSASAEPTSASTTDALPSEPLKLTSEPVAPAEKDASSAANPPNITITPSSAATEKPPAEAVLPLTEEGDAALAEAKQEEEEEAAPSDAVAETKQAEAKQAETKQAEPKETTVAAVEEEKPKPATVANAHVEKAVNDAKSDASGPVMSATSGPLDDHPAL